MYREKVFFSHRGENDYLSHLNWNTIFFFILNSKSKPIKIVIEM